MLLPTASPPGERTGSAAHHREGPAAARAPRRRARARAPRAAARRPRCGPRVGDRQPFRSPGRAARLEQLAHRRARGLTASPTRSSQPPAPRGRGSAPSRATRRAPRFRPDRAVARTPCRAARRAGGRNRPRSGDSSGFAQAVPNAVTARMSNRRSRPYGAFPAEGHTTASDYRTRRVDTPPPRPILSRTPDPQP